MSPVPGVVRDLTRQTLSEKWLSSYWWVENKRGNMSRRKLNGWPDRADLFQHSAREQIADYRWKMTNTGAVNRIGISGLTSVLAKK
jgi:hypothetical protein